MAWGQDVERGPRGSEGLNADVGEDRNRLRRWDPVSLAKLVTGKM